MKSNETLACSLFLNMIMLLCNLILSPENGQTSCIVKETTLSSLFLQPESCHRLFTSRPLCLGELPPAYLVCACPKRSLVTKTLVLEVSMCLSEQWSKVTVVDLGPFFTGKSDSTHIFKNDSTRVLVFRIVQ